MALGSGALQNLIESKVAGSSSRGPDPPPKKALGFRDLGPDPRRFTFRLETTFGGCSAREARGARYLGPDPRRGAVPKSVQCLNQYSHLINNERQHPDPRRGDFRSNATFGGCSARDSRGARDLGPDPRRGAVPKLVQCLNQCSHLINNEGQLPDPRRSQFGPGATFGGCSAQEAGGVRDLGPDPRRGAVPKSMQCLNQCTPLINNDLDTALI